MRIVQMWPLAMIGTAGASPVELSERDENSVMICQHGKCFPAPKAGPSTGSMTGPGPVPFLAGFGCSDWDIQDFSNNDFVSQAIGLVGTLGVFDTAAGPLAFDGFCYVEKDFSLGQFLTSHAAAIQTCPLNALPLLGAFTGTIRGKQATTWFALRSANYGCTDNLGLATCCTLRFTGQRLDGSTVTQEVAYEKGDQLQHHYTHMTFDQTFYALKSVRVEVVQSSGLFANLLGTRAVMDNVEWAACWQK